MKTIKKFMHILGLMIALKCNYKEAKEMYEIFKPFL